MTTWGSIGSGIIGSTVARPASAAEVGQRAASSRRHHDLKTGAMRRAGRPNTTAGGGRP